MQAPLRPQGRVWGRHTEALLAQQRGLTHRPVPRVQESILDFVSVLNSERCKWV